MYFKEVISNIYTSNPNKRLNNNQLVEENTDLQNNTNNKNIRRNRHKKIIIYDNNKSRSPSPTRRNRGLNHHFQLSNELKYSLVNKKNASLSPPALNIDISNKNANISAPNTIITNQCLPSPINTPIRNPKRLLENEYNYFEAVENNPFLTPPPSNTKINQLLINNKTENVDRPNNLISDFASLNIVNSKKLFALDSHPIFEIPEILNQIIKYVVLFDEKDNKILEKPYKKRPPESYNHALLMCKNETAAKRIWNQTLLDRQNNNTLTSNPNRPHYGPLFNCLLVNKKWFRLTMSYLVKNLFFSDIKKLNLFLDQYEENTKSNSDNILKIESMTLNKIRLTSTNNDDIEKLFQFKNGNIFSNLKKLKIHICPNFKLPSDWFSNFCNLEEFVITGNKVINDDFLVQISKNLTNLKTLDLRACENISDVGIVSIAVNCKNLKLINVGRHRKGSLITDKSLVALGKYTNVETIGFAGTKITDQGLWEFAKLNGDNIKRLSLNSCKLLTDYSVPYLIGFNYFPHLSVLEIRFIDKLMDMKYIIKFKLWKKSLRIPLLIEGCERITGLLRLEEERMKRYSCKVALDEMTAWINRDDIDNE